MYGIFAENTKLHGTSSNAYFAFVHFFSSLAPVLGSCYMKWECPKNYGVNWVQKKVNAIYESNLKGMDNMAFITACHWMVYQKPHKNVIKMYKSSYK